MAAGVIERFRRWFEYERDAHARVLKSMETVPPERRDGPEFRKALAVSAHIIAARRLWLARLGVIPPRPGALFPEDATLESLAPEYQEVERHWTDFLAGLDDEAIEREFEYRSLDAGRFRNRVEDILAQLFGHSSYHRGQIAMLVRAAGGEPAITDLIYWCREPVS